MFRRFVFGLLLGLGPAAAQTPLLTATIPNPPPCDGNEIGGLTVCFNRGADSIGVRVTGPTLPVTIEAVVISTPSLPWLRVGLPDGDPGTKITATPPFDFTISQDFDSAAQIKAGAHLGYVQLSSSETNQKVRIPVRLGVPGDSLTALPDVVELTVQAGRTARKEIRMDDLSRPDKRLETVLATYTTDGGDWLSGSLNAGLSPCVTSPYPCDLALEIKAPATTGDYEGALTVTSDGRAMYIRVRLKVTPAPPPEVTSDPRLPAAFAKSGATTKITLPVKVSSPGDAVPFRVVTQAPWISHILSSQTLPATIIFSLDPAGLDPGAYSDLVTVREAGTDRALLAFPVTFYIVVPEYLSHLSDGAGWKSKVYVVNLGAQDASFALQFRQAPSQSGQPKAGEDWPIDFAGRTRATSLIEETVPPLGVRVYETAGTSRTLQQGWAEFRPGGAVAAYVVLQRSVGTGGALPPLDAFVPLANSIGDRVIVPFDHGNDGSTEVALANVGEGPATVSVTVRNENGTDARTGPAIALSRRGHTVVSLVNEAAMGGKTAGLKGTVEFALPGGQLLASALRRKGSGMAPNPVLGSTPVTSVRGIPYIASGSGWTTSVQLFNSAERDQPGTLQFWQKSGGEELPLWFPNEELRKPQVSQTVPRREAVSFSTVDREPAASAGWAEAGFQPVITGYARLRQARTGQAPPLTVYENTIPSQRAFASKLMLAFDNTGDVSTTVVLVNTGGEAATAQIVLYDERGRFRLGTETTPLPAYGQVRIRLEEKFSEDLVLGKRGLVEVSAQNTNLTGVAIRAADGPAVMFPPVSR
ncbi:MAG: hypothetical protein U0Q16_31510 [Bryobacteraceae bacterium]